MPAGIQIFNAGQTLQIDDTYKSILYWSKLSGSFSSTSGIGEVALDAPYIYAASGPTLADGQSSSNQKSLFYFGEYSSAWRLYKFRLGSASNIGYGLEVYNGSGEKCFHTADIPLRVIDVVQVGIGQWAHDGNTNGNVVTRTYASGRTYAVVTLSPIMDKYVTQSAINPTTTVYFAQWYAYGPSISNGTITFKWIKWQEASQQDAEPSSFLDTYLLDNRSTATFMVIDITGA